MLQKNFSSEKVKNSKNILFFQEMDLSNDAFVDSIEIIKQLDLVITSDTSIAHLSATLGIKTWIVLPFVSDWRCFQDKKKTKWYKNVTLYKSQKIEDWNYIFNNMLSFKLCSKLSHIFCTGSPYHGCIFTT